MIVSSALNNLYVVFFCFLAFVNLIDDAVKVVNPAAPVAGQIAF